MTRKRLFNRSLHIALAALTFGMLLAPGTAMALTQRDWMIALVDGLGRSFGLPDQPKPDDYLRILQGTRTLRYEAEAVRAEDDEVSALAFLNYGPFSGTGWILGTSKPTQVHLRFVLPLDGRYRLDLALRLPGHTVKVGDKTFPVDGDRQHFSTVEAGEVELTAGPQEVIVTLPPGGAIDYLELKAPNLPAIGPASGWQPDTPLSWEVLAVTAIQALRLQAQLPATERTIAIEAETVAQTGGARVVEDVHLGQPSGGRWLRTAAQPIRIEIPFTIADGGFYDVEMAVMGNPVELLVNHQLSRSVEGKPYLDTVTLPALFFPSGANLLEVTLPPGGGLDRVALKARQSDLPALAKVLDLAMSGAAPVSADLDRLTLRLTGSAR